MWGRQRFYVTLGGLLVPRPTAFLSLTPALACPLLQALNPAGPWKTLPSGEQ